MELKQMAKIQEQGFLRMENLAVNHIYLSLFHCVKHLGLLVSLMPFNTIIQLKNSPR